MSIQIRKGSYRDLESFIALLQEVRESMEQKEWFYVDPPEEIWNMMTEGILELWIAKDGERMVAAFDIIRPGLREFNYGYDLCFTDEELMQVINMDSAAVHPDYRGQGLQRRLVAAAEAELRTEGEHILLCTVHPENRFSLRNVQNQGYTIQKEQAKYGSVRYVLRKDIL